MKIAEPAAIQIAKTDGEKHIQGDNKSIENGIRIRNLTPKETWRLMGFSDEDFDKASKAVSKSQLYKQAGNSIVVNVLMAVFKEMLPK